MKDHKIVILDDDKYPEGRVSERVVPAFHDLGFDAVVHYRTFDEMKNDILRERLSRDALFIVDSSLEEEPDHHLKDFGNTIPAMLDMLEINYKHIMPASGKPEGRENNRIFFKILERRGKIEDWGQRALEAGGLAGNPARIARSILEYFDVLYPGELSREVKREIAIPIGEATARPLR